MRRLATIATVHEIAPIPGADRIELATVKGWQCVVAKSDGLRPGDRCLYIEIDSVVPSEDPRFAFLAQRRWRVRTIKLRGVYSQGLCLPLTAFPELANKPVDFDATDLLRIRKHDPEAERERKSAAVSTEQNPLRQFLMQFRWFRNLHRRWFPDARRGWPQFLRKTDEERIQNFPDVLTRYAGEAWYCTEKVDGSSSTFAVTWHRSWWGGRRSVFTVCSRNIHLFSPSDNIWWTIARKYDLRGKLESLGRDIALQGEIVGPGVQGNKYGLDALRLYVFNAWDIAAQRYLPYAELVALCESLGLPMVPVLGEHTSPELTADEVVRAAVGTSVLNPKTRREGVVWRTETNRLHDRPVSFKAINPEFLLHYEAQEELAEDVAATR